MTDLPYLAQGPLAEAFAEQTKDFAFLYDRGSFAAWVGTRWSIGDPDDLLIKGAVNKYLGGLFSQYPEPTGKNDYRRALLDSRFRQGVMDQVKPLLPAWKFAEEFDRDPLLLGVPGNQVLDLRTGICRPVQREDRITKRTNVAPNASGKPIRFLRFMQEITCGDDALNGYLMRYCGYVLTGHTREHNLPFWYGHGANGKGTALMAQACLEWQAIGLAPPERVTQATRQLFAELDPIGRFISERLAEDPDSFVTTEEYVTAYLEFERDTGYESGMYVERDLIGRLQALPGVSRARRNGKDGTARRGLLGRRMKGPQDQNSHVPRPH